MSLRLVPLLVLFTTANVVFADPAKDEYLLREARVGTDGPALLDFLRRHSPGSVRSQDVAELVRKLGSEDFAERERATLDLLALGAASAAYLRPVLQDADPERAMRARRCLRIIDAGPGPEVHAAVIRLLADRKPAGAVEVLLNYLPFAPDDAARIALRQSLRQLAVQDGKAEPALVTALADKLPAKRAAAAVALIGAGHIPPAVDKLLADADLTVRLRVSLALIDRGEKTAVPVLIDLLAVLPRDQVGPIEAALYRLAGDSMATAALGSDLTPAKARDVWLAWWKQNQGTVNLKPAAEPKLRGFTLIVSMEEGTVQEIAADGTLRWKIADLAYPMTAQLIDEKRILIAEYRGGRVTERDLQGKVLWEKKIAWPVAAQRFSDGKTFIATRTSLVEIDRAGKETYTHHMPGQIVMAAQKLRNGHIACMTSAGTFKLLDSQGKEVRNFQVGAVNFGCGFDVLSNGNVLVPEYRGNLVVEWDPQGKKVWSAKLNGPQAAVRLPNGNTLMASSAERLLIEVDREGRRVWEHRTKMTPARVQRR